MLIVISAIAASACLLGVLLVGHSTAGTIAEMQPLRPEGSQVTDFPADVEEQLASQQIVTPGLASVSAEEAQLQEAARNNVEGLRAAIAAITQQTDGTGNIELGQLYAELQQELLSENQALQLDADTLEQVREMALRNLTEQDGSIALPDYELDFSALDSPSVATLMQQVQQLQAQLNSELLASGILDDREVELDTITLDGDLGQLDAAIDALGLQRDLLGIEFGPNAEYQALGELGDELLAPLGVSLEGLDLEELETVTRDLLQNL